MKKRKRAARKKAQRVSPKDFVDRFLAVRELSEPNGKRLYEYRCDDREYRDLRSLLRDHEDPQHLRTAMDGFGHVRADDAGRERDETAVMACFVLYAAEWYRRWDDTRRRTWGRLLGSIYWKRKDYPELYRAVVDGLRQWRRPVIKMPGSTRYFDTIGREAGKPIEGFAVIEYALASQDEWPAKYEPQFQSEGVESGTIQVWTRAEDAAPERVLGLFDIGTVR